MIRFSVFSSSSFPWCPFPHSRLWSLAANPEVIGAHGLSLLPRHQPPSDLGRGPRKALTVPATVSATASVPPLTLRCAAQINRRRDISSLRLQRRVFLAQHDRVGSARVMSYDVTWTPHGDAPCGGATGAGSRLCPAPWQSSELPACSVRPAVPPCLRAASSQFLSGKAVLVFGTVTLSSGSSPAAGFSPNGRVVSGPDARQAGGFAALVNAPHSPGFDVSSLRLTEAFETAVLWVEGAKRHTFSLRPDWGRQQLQPRNGAACSSMPGNVLVPCSPGAEREGTGFQSSEMSGPSAPLSCYCVRTSF